MEGYEVVSAFLDDEPFDPADLAHALGEPAGRQLLLELVALRTLVRDEPIAPLAPSHAPRTVSRPRWIAVGFLAASLLFGAAWLLPALVRQQHDEMPPTPTRVVTFETGASAP